jgi:glutamine cyclotransferase
MVTDINGRVGYLNELEYINGYVYANIWLTDLIAQISPGTGKITGWVDLKGINPPLLKLKKSHVLNGIAYNKKNKTIIITGKCWPWLYEIELITKE